MTVVRDDEIIAPVSSPVLPPAMATPNGYYMPAAMTNYGQLYIPAPGTESVMSAYSYPIHMQAPHPPGGLHPMMTPMPQFQDHTEIMSIIPTLRCWSCVKCGNLNYAHRLTCNLRKCPKGESDWMCACGNVNYRFRKYCNLRKCQLPQIGNPFLFFGINQLIKTGYAPQTALSLLLTNTVGGDSVVGSEWTRGGPPEPTSPHKEGCWQCATCGNLNWPWRDECNRKGCSETKSSAMA